LKTIKHNTHMKTPHTPAPWKVRTSNRGDIVIHNEQGNCIADCNMGASLIKSEREANANLIAAAPDLLEALKTLVENCVPIPKEIFTRVGAASFQKALNNAAAAIQAAEGTEV